MICTNVCQGTAESLQNAKSELVYSGGATWTPGNKGCICITAWYLTAKAFYKHQHADRAASQSRNKILTSNTDFLPVSLEMLSVI